MNSTLDGWSDWAHICITGKTCSDVEIQIREAMQFHIEGVLPIHKAQLLSYLDSRNSHEIT